MHTKKYIRNIEFCKKSNRKIGAYMQNFDNRLERLDYLLRKLSKGAKLSTPKLVSQLNLTKKIIQTDFNTYILPYVDTVYYDASLKCYVAQSDFLDLLRIDSRQLATIIIIKAKATDKYSPEGLSECIDALCNEYSDLLAERMYAKSRVESLKHNEDRVFIENAIKSKSVITCHYNNKERELCPLSIINLEGFWYLVNYDREYDDIRRYHLKSITQVIITEEAFKITDDIREILERFKYAINAYFEPLVEPFVVELYVDAKVAKYFKRMPLNLRQRIMKQYDDGSVDLEIWITDYMEIIPTIQRYMPYVRVIEPKGLRDRVKEIRERF